MKEIITNVVGYAATVIGTCLMLPQVIKMAQTKRVDDVSIAMTIAYLLNCALWGIYGVLLGTLPLILCNSIAFVIGLVQFYLKIKYGKKKEISL